MTSIVSKTWGSYEVLHDDLFERKENENIFIPLKAKHRLANHQSVALVVIELWFGDQLDEEDIIRYEDIYNR